MHVSSPSFHGNGDAIIVPINSHYYRTPFNNLFRIESLLYIPFQNALNLHENHKRVRLLRMKRKIPIPRFPMSAQGFHSTPFLSNNRYKMYKT